MKKLAIIGASYLQLPLIEKAKEMGYETHVFAWEAHDVGEDAADYFYPISIVEKEEVLRKCKEIGICGICSIASDLAVITVNYIANAMGLVGNSMESTVLSTNKHAMRHAFEKNGNPSPKSVEVASYDDIHIEGLSFPVIVKPTDRSGSRGIHKLYDENGLEEAVDIALHESFEHKALIEEFAEGKEYSVEFISFQGQHHFLALTEKFTTGEPYFIETGHLEPAPVQPEVLKKIQNVVCHALNSLEVLNGASHSEVKVDSDGNIKIIEIGARMGGDCIGSDLVFYSTGIDFVKQVINIAVGNKPDLEPEKEGISARVQFILTSQDLQGFEELRREQPERILKVVDYHPENIGHTTDSSNRAGCYIIKD